MSFKRELTSNTETKPGVFTTEFLLTALLNFGGLVELVADPFNIPNKYVVLAMAVVTAIYSTARGLAKQGSTYIPVSEYDLNRNGEVEEPPAPNTTNVV